MNMSFLFKPRTIAVVGAGDKEGTFGGDTCRNLMENTDPSKFYFVNPKRQEIFGKKCFPSLEDLPIESIDQIILCTPKSTVIGLLHEAARKHCKSAVIFASGYRETGTSEGIEAEKELVKTCQQLGIVAMGPNCGGYVNFVDNLHGFAFLSEKRDRKGAVGLVAQSGQVCLSSFDTPNMRMSYAVSAGNCAVAGMEDYLQFMVDDPDTKVVAMFLEGVSRPDKFIQALKKAAAIKKPVVILKVGRSEKGSATAASHTGSLSGTDATFDAIFRKFGVIRADDFLDLITTALTLATWEELPKLSTAGCTSFSGGETGMTADVAYLAGVQLPDFAQSTLDALRQVLPFYATPRNPLDTTVTVAYDEDAYASVVSAIMEDPNIGMVILGYTLLFEISDPAIHFMYKGIEKALSTAKIRKPIALLPFGENSRNPEYLNKLDTLGVPILPPLMYGMRVIRHIADFIDFHAEKHTLELALPQISDSTPAKRQTLSEFESMNLLKTAGVRVPAGAVAETAEQAVRIAKKAGMEQGKKIVLKIASADIPHKTDAGGVRLHLSSEAEVQRAFEDIMKSCRAYAPTASIDGVFVQEMLEPGLEVIVGVTCDPLFGPQILCGLGGVFVEIFKDTALYPAPLNTEEALSMIRSLKAFPLFTGYRGNPHLDVNALAETLVAVGRFAQKNSKELLELDINPVFVYPQGKGVCAADALVVMRQ